MNIKVETFDAELSPHDERWIEQVGGLHADLEREAGAITLHRTPVAGHKAGASEVILALGSAGAITAAVQCFALWLKYGRGRRIKLTVSQDGEPLEIEVHGEGMDKAVIERALCDAFEASRRVQ